MSSSSAFPPASSNRSKISLNLDIIFAPAYLQFYTINKFFEAYKILISNYFKIKSSDFISPPFFYYIRTRI